VRHSLLRQAVKGAKRLFYGCAGNGNERRPGNGCRRGPAEGICGGMKKRGPVVTLSSG